MIASRPQLDTTPRAVHENQVHSLICCRRKTQRQSRHLQKSLSREQLCVPLSLPACPRWMSSLTLLGHSAVRDPPAALSDIHLHTTLLWYLKCHCSLICGIHKKLLIQATAQIWMGLVGNGNDPCHLHGGRYVEEGREKTECWQGNAAEHMENKSSNPPGGIRFALFQQDTGTSILVISPCPNLSHSCHPCRRALWC